MSRKSLPRKLTQTEAEELCLSAMLCNMHIAVEGYPTERDAKAQRRVLAAIEAWARRVAKRVERFTDLDDYA